MVNGLYGNVRPFRDADRQRERGVNKRWFGELLPTILTDEVRRRSVYLDVLQCIFIC